MGRASLCYRPDVIIRSFFQKENIDGLIRYASLWRNGISLLRQYLRGRASFLPQQQAPQQVGLKSRSQKTEKIPPSNTLFTVEEQYRDRQQVRSLGDLNEVLLSQHYHTEQVSYTPLYQVYLFPDLTRLVTSCLDAKEPNLRHISRSWTIEAVQYLPYLIDPLLEDLLAFLLMMVTRPSVVDSFLAEGAGKEEDEGEGVQPANLCGMSSSMPQRLAGSFGGFGNLGRGTALFEEEEARTVSEEAEVDFPNAAATDSFPFRTGEQDCSSAGKRTSSQHNCSGGTAGGGPPASSSHKFEDRSNLYFHTDPLINARRRVLREFYFRNIQKFLKKRLPDISDCEDLPEAVVTKAAMEIFQNGLSVFEKLSSILQTDYHLLLEQLQRFAPSEHLMEALDEYYYCVGRFREFNGRVPGVTSGGGGGASSRGGAAATPQSEQGAPTTKGSGSGPSSGGGGVAADHLLPRTGTDGQDTGAPPPSTSSSGSNSGTALPKRKTKQGGHPAGSAAGEPCSSARPRSVSTIRDYADFICHLCLCFLEIPISIHWDGWQKEIARNLAHGVGAIQQNILKQDATAQAKRDRAVSSSSGSTSLSGADHPVQMGGGGPPGEMIGSSNKSSRGMIIGSAGVTGAFGTPFPPFGTSAVRGLERTTSTALTNRTAFQLDLDALYEMYHSLKVEEILNAIRAISCEFLKSFLGPISNIGKGERISYILLDPLLDIMDRCIRAQDYTIQVHLLGIIRVIIVLSQKFEGPPCPLATQLRMLHNVGQDFSTTTPECATISSSSANPKVFSPLNDQEDSARLRTAGDHDHASQTPRSRTTASRKMSGSLPTTPSIMHAHVLLNPGSTALNEAAPKTINATFALASQPMHTPSLVRPNQGEQAGADLTGDHSCGRGRGIRGKRSLACYPPLLPCLLKAIGKMQAAMDDISAGAPVEEEMLLTGGGTSHRDTAMSNTPPRSERGGRHDSVTSTPGGVVVTPTLLKPLTELATPPSSTVVSMLRGPLESVDLEKTASFQDGSFGPLKELRTPLKPKSNRREPETGNGALYKKPEERNTTYQRYSQVGSC